MTSRWERPASAWPLGAWIMAGILGVVTGLGVSAGVLSPGLLLDGIALWPGLVPALVALLVVALRKSWARRVGAIPPLLLITWIGLTGGAHLGGWVALPSSAGELIGPEASPESATMSISAGGRLVVGSNASPHLYEVRYIRLGGPVGVPDAVETSTDTSLNVTVTDRGTSTWFRYAGWRLELNRRIEWNLDLGGDVAGDVSGLVLGSLTLDGSGNLTLGAVAKPTPLSVLGDYVINLPSEAAATATGNVQPPANWEGNTSPGGADGWVISVSEGGSLIINQP